MMFTRVLNNYTKKCIIFLFIRYTCIIHLSKSDNEKSKIMVTVG